MALLIGLSFGAQVGNRYRLDNWLHDGMLYGIVIGISSLALSVLLPASSPRLVTSIPHATRGWSHLVQLSRTMHGRRAWVTFAALGAGVGLSYGLSGGLSYGLLSLGLIFGLSEGLTTAALLLDERGVRETVTLLF